MRVEPIRKLEEDNGTEKAEMPQIRRKFLSQTGGDGL